MITGDNVNTAYAIATECGIIDEISNEENDISKYVIEGSKFSQ